MEPPGKRKDDMLRVGVTDKDARDRVRLSPL